MEKIYTIIFFIIILGIIIIYNNKEHFTNNEADNIKNTLESIE